MNLDRKPAGFLYSASCALALAMAYIFAAAYGQRLDFMNENERVLLPQSGVALAGLIVFGVRYWPVVTLSSLIVSISGARPAELFALFSHGQSAQFQRPLTFALVIAVGNTLASVLGAILIRHRSGYKPGLLRVRDVYDFLVYGCILAPVINTLFAVTGMLFHLNLPVQLSIVRSLIWKRWYGHAVSNLIVAPAILTWSRKPELNYPPVRIVETLCLVGCIIATLLAVFSERLAIGGLNYPISFLPFPVMIWAALRYGPRGGATATFILAAVAVYGTSMHYGPFAKEDPAEGLVLLQVYLTSIAISVLFLGSAMAERREVISALTHREEQLTHLSERLETAREQERQMIAREIHDELGQQLTGIKMGIHGLTRRAVSMQPEFQAQKIRDLLEQTDIAVDTVRHIATSLRPGILDDLGLLPALQWLVNDFEERSGIEARLECKIEPPPMDSQRTIALFRVAQEALTNILRHAQANTVQVMLNWEDNRLELMVEDDGVGISGDAAQSRSPGIVGMRERMTLLGGSFEISSANAIITGGASTPGTRIRARLPLGKVEE